jgi:hypothetical protein
MTISDIQTYVKETSVKDTSDIEAFVKETSDIEAFVKETSDMEASVKDTSDIEAFVKDTYVKETSDMEASDVDTSDIEASDVGTSDMEASVKETFDMEASDVDISVKETSDMEASVKETSDIEASDVDTSDIEASDVDTSDMEASVKEITDMEASVKETSDMEASVKETSDMEASDTDNNNIINTYENVIILSGGKTGTSTLVKSFEELLAPATSKVILFFSSMGWEEIQRLSLVLVKENKRVLVVNSFREPISRMISSLFQHLLLHVPELKDINIYDEDNIVETFTYIKEKMDFYLETGNYFENYHSVRFTDMKKMDIKQDLEQKGFCFIQDKLYPLDYLFLKFDNIHEWETQISSIIPGFILLNRNISEDKDYHSLYKYFKKNYSNPKFQGLIDSQEDLLHYYNSYEKAKKVALSFNRK